MENKNYIQSQLQKDGISRIEWVEERYAVKGNILDIKENNNWQSGWEIKTLGGKVDSETLLKVIHMSHIEIRKI